MDSDSDDQEYEKIDVRKSGHPVIGSSSTVWSPTRRPAMPLPSAPPGMFVCACVRACTSVEMWTP